MQVYVAENCGFCAGVKRAVDTALSVPPENTYVLGELIHNGEVVRRIAARGIVTVSSAEEVPAGASLIIRSHGAGKAVYEVCAAKGIRVIDCTCPYVARTQRIVEAAYAAGKTIVVAGQKDHPEVEGLIGRCGGEAFVFADGKEDFGPLAEKNVVLVSQTTFSEQKFSEIVQNLQKVGPKTVEIFKTICYTTIDRQREAGRLSALCDAVVVIGGANSSNTEKLCEVVSAHGKQIIRVTGAGGFEYEKIKNFGRVGVIAGASTPDWQTQEVLSKMAENNAEVQETVQAEEAVQAEETVGEVLPAAPADIAEPVTEGETAAEAAQPAAEPVSEAPEAPEAPATAEAPAAPKSAMEQLMEADETQPYRKGSVIKVTIVHADDDKIFVSSDGKTENVIEKQDLDCEEYSRELYKAREGEEIEVYVTEVKPKVVLSEKAMRTLKEEAAELAAIADGAEFSVVCTGSNKGGLTAQFHSYPVFVPASEIRSGYVRDFDRYIGKKLRLKVKKPEDIRRTGRKEIVASQRVILEAEQAERDAAKAAKEAAFFGSIREGDVVEGKVERVTTFGAFVSVNGFDCLAHISDLSWTGVKQVTDVLEIGKRYQFKVLKVDAENKKVSIGYKQLQPQPWDLAAEKYAEGQVVHGKVVRIVPFGAFVEIEKGIDGLVHISQITHEWLENPTSVLKIGEEVDAQIIAFDPEKRRITLSIKALQPRPEYEPREREPRRDREEGGKPSRQRKGGRRTAEPEGEEEYREWKDEGYSGASISELLGGNDDEK